MKFGSPSEYCRGAPPDRLFAGCCPPARADGSGRPLVGFNVPTTHELRVPRSAVTGLAPAAGGEECHFLTGGPPSGFLNPSAVLAATTLVNPSCPGPTLTPSLRPGTSRPYSMPQASLGFALQSLPLSESRAAFRRPFAPLRVRARSQSGAKAPVISDRFRKRAPPRATPTIPCGSRSDSWKGKRRLPTAVMSGRRVHRASCPARRPSTTNRNFRAPPAHGRSARFEALLPPRVRSPTDRASCRGSRARACAPTHCDRTGRCSPGFEPLQSLLRHDLGFVLLRVPPGANRTILGRPRPTPERSAALRS